MGSENEKEESLTYTLLLELLAHQIAFPVKWIDTQDAIFGQEGIERTVEIGPSATLTGMAKQTIQLKYKDQDTTRTVKRALLSTKSDVPELYFDPSTQVERKSKAAEAVVEAPSAPVAEAAPVPAPAPAASSNAGLTSVAPSSMADAAVRAEDILLTLIAEKMKKTIPDIPLDASIKKLSGGRSTLENEIIGDLLSEFGNLPEKAEDASMRELSDSLAASGDRRLGKVTNMLIGRVVGTKMPGGFSANSARKYLETRWGFASGRQDSVLLSTITSVPPARLASEKDTETYLDGLVRKHALASGFALNEGGSQQSAAGPAANPEAVKAIIKDQEDLARESLKVYANYLGIDLNAGPKVSALLDDVIADLQSQLKLWETEHGETYAAGIAPVFDALKVRQYSSYWNWALQDLLSLVEKIKLGQFKLADAALEELSFRITNRANPRLLEVMEYLQSSVQEDTTKAYLRALVKVATHSLKVPSTFRTFSEPTAPKTIVDLKGNIKFSEVARQETSASGSSSRSGSYVMIEDALPVRHIKRKDGDGWKYSSEFTNTYIEALDKITKSGLSFKEKVVLLTGAGLKSIGSELISGLLAGGAKVIVTTSNLSAKTAANYQKTYATYGGKGSNLVLVPFNQGSHQDIEALTDYIYDREKGLGWDLDFVIPFAAIGTAGRAIDTIDSKSELANRIMLINVIRLLGSIKKHKADAGFVSRPCHAILPLSPNHGNFGNDGLYAESKIALESLFNKWSSEGWSNYISLVGASIGWTRGTGLMNQNDIVAEGLEKLGGRTFSREEMAISILGLMDQPLVEICQVEPLYADLTGGLNTFPDLNGTLAKIRGDLNSLSDIRRAVRAEIAEDTSLIHGGSKSTGEAPKPLAVRAHLDLGFPELSAYDQEIKDLSANLKGMVDLEKVVVIVGFAETGPWGNARTRWEMEAFGRFTLEGITELAWVMGLIKFAKLPGQNGGMERRGWVDAKTKAPVEESEIREKYEEFILQHTGIRVIEPTLFDNYDPHKRQLLQEVVIQQDLAAFEASAETAKNFKRQHGEYAEIIAVDGSEDFSVYIKKGATLLVPKAIDFHNDVAAMLPMGWNPRTYGIADDIIAQVDPNTLYVLVSTLEALLMAGITDPYEIYQYIHFSELGNCVGTGTGGQNSLAQMYKDRYIDKPVQMDILQETFPNTSSAWVNMLLLSSAGPIRTPVGACATALESLDLAVDTILSGKARMCLVGGADDFNETTSNEFSNMKATSNAADERAKGREPKEMSRPSAASRKGFMESHGAGIELVCTAKLALAMGLPIYSIVAHTGTSSDKASRSVPAPGKGVITNAMEVAGSRPSPLLDIKYRKRQIDIRRKQINEWKATELEQVEDSISLSLKQDPSFDAVEYRKYMIGHFEREAQKQEGDILNRFGNDFWKNHPEIAPIRGSLATWGLTIDDLGVASLHGTSTVMNDKNESSILQAQLTHLGRTKGNTIMGVSQKYLTGHSKGAAGSWMLNGCMQILNTGLVPGNRNVDNLDDGFQQYDLLSFPNRAIQTTGIKAFSVTSFGFGQKGAQCIGIHPKYLFATIERGQYEEYKEKCRTRKMKATSWFNEGLIGNCLFDPKDKPPYDIAKEVEVLLNPSYRVTVSAL